VGVRCVGQRVHHRAAGDATRRKHRDAGEDKAAAHRDHRAPPVRREGNGAREARRGKDQQNPDGRLEQVEPFLGRVELAGADDLQLRDIRREALRDVGRQSGLGSDLLHQLLEIEGKRAVGEIAIHECEQRVVRLAVRFAPGVQGDRGAEHARGVANRDLLEPRGRGTSQWVEPIGQDLPRPLLHLSTRVHVVDDEGSERCAAARGLRANHPDQVMRSGAYGGTLHPTRAPIEEDKQWRISLPSPTTISTRPRR
jgi:hypothetical protein